MFNFYKTESCLGCHQFQVSLQMQHKEYEELHSKKNKEIMELRSEIENLKREKEKMIELQGTSLNEIKKWQKDSQQMKKIRDVLNEDSEFIISSPKPEQPQQLQQQKPEQTQNSSGGFFSFFRSPSVKFLSFFYTNPTRLQAKTKSVFLCLKTDLSSSFYIVKVLFSDKKEITACERKTEDSMVEIEFTPPEPGEYTIQLIHTQQNIINQATIKVEPFVETQVYVEPSSNISDALFNYVSSALKVQLPEIKFVEKSDNAIRIIITSAITERIELYVDSKPDPKKEIIFAIQTAGRDREFHTNTIEDPWGNLIVGVVTPMAEPYSSFTFRHGKEKFLDYLKQLINKK